MKYPIYALGRALTGGVLLLALTSCAGSGASKSVQDHSPLPVGPGTEAVSVTFDCINQVCVFQDIRPGLVSRIHLFGVSPALSVNTPINGTAVVFAEFTPAAQGFNIPVVSLYSNVICVYANVYETPILTQLTGGAPYLTSSPNIDAGYCWDVNSVTQFSVVAGRPIAMPGRSSEGWVNTFSVVPEFTFLTQPTFAGTESGSGLVSEIGGLDTSNVQHFTETCVEDIATYLVSCSYFKLDLTP